MPAKKHQRKPARKVSYEEVLAQVTRLQARNNELEGRAEGMFELKAKNQKLELDLTKERLHTDALQRQLHAALTGHR